MGHLSHGLLHVAPYFGSYGYLRTYRSGGYLGDATYPTDAPTTVYQDSDDSQYRSSKTIDQRGEPSSLLGAGRQLMKGREYERATDTFMEAVLAAPQAGLPKLLFGHALFAAGDYDYAAYAIGRAIDRIDDLDAVSPGVDDLYRDADEFERLVYKLHDHARRHGLDADAHFLLGYFRYFAGDHESAVRSFDQALRLNRVHRHATALRKFARAKSAASSQARKVEPEPADDE